MVENVNLTDAQLDSIMERIQKMLRLRDNEAATTGEVANAAAMVQKLLTQYNLTMSEIESRGATQRPVSEMGRSDFDLGVSQGYQQRWRAALVYNVARYGWCRAVFVPGTPSRPRFDEKTGQWVTAAPVNAHSALIGKAYNVRVCIELSEWLISELDRLSRASWKQYAALNAGRPGRKTREYESRMFKNSFIAGAINEITARLAEQHRQSQGDSAVTALAVVSDQALSVEVHKHFPSLKKSRHRMGGNDGAYAAGQHAGRNISLSPMRKLDGTGSSRRLGR